MKKILYLLIITALLIPISAQMGEIVEMELVGIDPSEEFTEVDDLTSVWMGQSSQALYFVVQFTNHTRNGASANITLRDASNNVYLLSISILNDSYVVTINSGESLFNPIIASNNDNSIQYIAKTIYFDPLLYELGVYFLWDDLGGQQEIDIIVWTGLPVDSWDRIPEQGYITFQGVNNIDRIIDFDLAINNNFPDAYISIEDSVTTSISTSSSINQSTSTYSNNDNSSSQLLILTTLFDDPTEGPNDSPTSSSAIVSIALVILIIVTFGYVRLTRQNGESKFSEPIKSSKPRNSEPAIPISSTDTLNMKYIPELNRKVRMCCYQTARLDETYCYCGRVVDQDLKDIF